MKKYLVLLAAGAAYLFYRLRKKADMLNKLTFTISSVIVKNSLDFTSLLKIQVVFEVHNITNQSLTIDKLSGDIYINGINLGSVEDSNIEIISNGSSKIFIMFNTFTMGTINAILDILKNKEAVFEAKGYVNILGVAVPFQVDKKLL